MEGYFKSLAESFAQLPSKAQELWFDFLMTGSEQGAVRFANEYGFDSIGESPIEKLFYFAFSLYRFVKGNADREFEKYLCIESQYEIQRTTGKKYFADFYLTHEYMESEKHGLIIECDGHDFHEKTKQQVVYRNNRDLELKKMGYDILHFSGSQIYQNPIKCASDVYNYFREYADINMEQESVI